MVMFELLEILYQRLSMLNHLFGDHFPGSTMFCVHLTIDFLLERPEQFRTKVLPPWGTFGGPGNP